MITKKIQFSKNNKHYLTMTDYYQNKYQRKVAKIPIDAGFTCPNKNGQKGFAGCIYCQNTTTELSIEEQYDKAKSAVKRKWPDALCIAYLQSNSNTYESIEKLKEIYAKVLSIDEDIIELAIATRPDCFSPEIYNYLEELNRKIPVTVELGLQTSNEKTAKFINRQVSNKEFISCVLELNARNIAVVAHIINGLPEETTQDMINTVDFLNDLPIKGLKIHSLLILKNTRLAQIYQTNPFKLLSLEEYVAITVKQIARLRPDIIIERLSADSLQDELIAPLWTRKKLVVMNEIDKKLRKNDLYQGSDYDFRKANRLLSTDACR